jgi:hypothetical protein
MQVVNSTGGDAFWGAYGSSYSGTRFGTSLAQSTEILMQAGTGSFFLGTFAARDIIVGTNNVERMRVTSGGDIQMGSNTVNATVSNATVNTTDATVTTAHTFATATNTIYLVEARITGRRTGGSAGSANDCATYVRRATFKNTGGTVTIHNLETSYTYEDQAGWDATLTLSGTNILAQVTGAVDNNITWNSTLTVNKVA